MSLVRHIYWKALPICKSANSLGMVLMKVEKGIGFPVEDATLFFFQALMLTDLHEQFF
ncbi:MAG: hypothetical protein KME10_28250 [Plectolyngbya sp. WJT66-NPBG17]|jgi:hypothetical protein|nr:hypothetical protein [Plectolyngbya sp. WJT66-NPBG17]